MQYAIILTTKPEGGIRVSIPALPTCTIEATSRDEAIHLARAAIVDIVRRSEVVHLDIPQQPTSLRDDVPWEWFGTAKGDPTWEPLFEVIEQQREETRKAR